MLQGLKSFFQQHWKALCAVILIFCGGFLSGIVGSTYYFKYKVKRLSDPASMKRMMEGRFSRISKQLELTPEQIKIIKPIIEESTLEMKHLREQTTFKLKQMRRAQIDRIMEVLTPEQIEKFKMIPAKRPGKDNTVKRGDTPAKLGKKDPAEDPQE